MVCNIFIVSLGEWKNIVAYYKNYVKYTRWGILLKPYRLKPGSKIAIISPSSGLPHIYPEIYALGLKNLKNALDIDVIEMPSARMDPNNLSKNPRLRAEDINMCFSDETIDGIITSIGGHESLSILPFLDPDIIINNPKFIMGFSDATTFLCYINQLGVVTFYGPSVMAGFAQINNLPFEFREHLKAFLFYNSFPYRYSPYKKWTDGYRNWSDLDRLGECNPFFESEGWTFLQGNNITQGYIWGGCLEVLKLMQASQYWPNKDFWKDKVLIIETSLEKPTPNQIVNPLRSLGMDGIFSKIQGIIIGRVKGYNSQESQKLNYSIINVIREQFGAKHIPIIVDFNFGHTDPKLILPIGCKVEINPLNNEISLLESPFLN